MTDEQIVEGLRCCNNGLCEICPYHEDEFIADCREQNGNDALDLIRRQNAEIERLTELVNELAAGNVAWLADNHDLRVELKTAKADAIREFAERLKKRKYQSSDWSRGEHPYVVEESDIDEILEEMTEDKP